MSIPADDAQFLDDPMSNPASAQPPAEELSIAELSHELRNMLATITGHADMIQRTAIQAQVRQWARTISSAALIAGELLAQMGYEDASTLSDRPCAHLENALAEAIELARPAIGNVRVNFHADDALPPVAIKHSALVQVFLNLLINAAEAMGGEGTVRVEAQLVPPENAVESEEDGWVEISVCDDGPGVPAHIAEQLFEPFVSTKSAGRGLGLSVVAKLLKQVGGSISVTSLAGAGTRFTLLVPVASPIADEQVCLSERPQGNRAIVVEDEPSVLSALSHILDSAGFEVLATSSGAQAMELAEKIQQADIIIVDLGMPDIDGVELLGCLSRLLPKASLLAITGRKDSALLAQVRRLGAEILFKPFSAAELLRTVQRLTLAA